MDGVLFFFNIILICFCSAASGISLLTYHKTKRPFYLYTSLLSVCFITEFIILQYVCSDVYFSGQTVTPTIINHISFHYARAVAYTAILILEFLCILWITETTWNKKFLFLFLPAIVSYTILGFAEQTIFVVWLFYSIRQFYQFGYLLFFSLRYLTAKEERMKQNLKRYSNSMTGIFFLNCSVLIEDTAMISHIKSLLFESPWMSERNFTENLLWIFLCCCFIYLCSQQLTVITATKTVESGSENQPVLVSALSSENNKTEQVSGALLQNLPAFSQYYKLTPRETEILKCLIDCQQTSEICEALHISTGTVKTHIHNIYMKLEINTRTELMRELSDFSTSEK